MTAQRRQRPSLMATALATRCPACGTVFRVVRDQLRVSEGWVRCGRCAEVFNAADGLVDLDSRRAARSDDAPTGASRRSRPAIAAADRARPARCIAARPLRQSADRRRRWRRTPSARSAAPTPTRTPPFDDRLGTPRTARERQAAAAPDAGRCRPAVDPRSTTPPSRRRTGRNRSPPAVGRRRRRPRRPAVRGRHRRARRSRPPAGRRRAARRSSAGPSAPRAGAGPACAAALRGRRRRCWRWLRRQVVYAYRDLVAARSPIPRPRLVAGCRWLGCRIGRRARSTRWRSKAAGWCASRNRRGLQAFGGTAQPRRHRGGVAGGRTGADRHPGQARWPARVLPAGELGARQTALAAGARAAAAGDAAARPTEPVAGYTIELFYP